MNKFHDQTGKFILVNTPPRRIVSLVPSQTELLSYLGLQENVIGITKFCVHPSHWFQSKTKIGGTKQLKIDLIRSLQPDLVIANKEENVKEQVEAIEQFCPVWTSDVSTIAEAYQMMECIGQLTGTEEKVSILIQEIKKGFSAHMVNRKIKAAYLIWQNPYMTIGGDTFINDMLQVAGFENVFSHQTRYPAITIDNLKETGCEVILLSSEPYPFKEKHVHELQQCLPHVKIILANGELFSWYGSRMQYAASYFEKLKESLFL